jgi:tRNA uridine 5-carbamoylmethylation protein Kti12
MFYADDTHIYVILNTTNRSTAIEKLESCAGAIKTWSEENKLVMNDSETEVVHVFSRHLSAQLSSITIGSSSVSPKVQARNLGVVFDKHINFKSHISHIGLSCPSEYWKDPKISRWPYN